MEVKREQKRWETNITKNLNEENKVFEATRNLG